MSLKYSGKQVSKAGEDLVALESMKSNPDKFSAAMDILSFWRFSHAEALDEAFLILQRVASQKDEHAIFAKRLKRYQSIVRKLQRFDNMKLRKMQDIGGCRVVLSNQKKLDQTVRELKKLPNFRNNTGKFKFKDYIKKPKEDGYRSFHLMGQFYDSQKNKKTIEIQLRTQLQHYWATALEIVDLFTDQALKSNQGDIKWKDFFTHVSRQFAIIENIHLFDTLSYDLIFDSYQKSLHRESDVLSCKKIQDLISPFNGLDVVNKLNAFAGSLQVINDQLSEIPSETGYILLEINTIKTTVSLKIFDIESGEEAEEHYVDAEKKSSNIAHIVIALISTSAVGNIKEAYPNYFADSDKFVEYLNLITKIRTVIHSSSIPKPVFFS